MDIRTFTVSFNEAMLKEEDKEDLEQVLRELLEGIFELKHGEGILVVEED